MLVLDSSAFIRGYDADEPTATVPSVREELSDENSYRFDALSGSGMTVHAPGDPARRRVRDAARATGDHDELSDTDVDLLAAAVELDATLVTDDYAMQNVAAHLDVDVHTIGREGITEQRDWRWQCQGCGRTFDDDPGRCPICGSDLARKNP